MTEFERRQLQAIKEELDRAFTARTAPAASAPLTASQPRLSSNDRT